MFKIVRRMIRWSENYRGRIYTGFVLSFFIGIFISIPMMLSALAIQAVLVDLQGGTEVTGRMILNFFLLMVAAIAGRFLFTYLKSKIQDTVVYERLADERIRMGGILKRVPLGFFEQNKTGDLLTAMTTDMSFMEYHAMTMLDMVVNGYITSAVMVLFCMAIDWKIGAMMLAGILFSAMFLHMMGVSSNRNAAALQKANEDMTSTTVEYLRGIALVKTFHQEGATAKGIQEAYRKSKDINVKIEKEYSIFHFLHMLSLKTATTAMVVYAAVMVWKGAMDLPVMVFVDIMSFMAFMSTENLSSAFHVLHVIDGTLDKLDRLTNASFIDEKGKDIKPENHEISFEHVSFAYDKRMILKDVSSGKITLGGKNLKEYTCDRILSQFSIVFQNVYLFHDTIMDNIRFGKPQASMDEVICAAKRAGCHDFIMELPDGYKTIIGEGGSTLSGGERQRISIARAILKDAPIIILDEATSSVDPENEHLIQNALNELIKGKTVIAIAHRLPTIEQADQILVLKDGQIIQRGTHKELIRQEGTYLEFIKIRKRSEGWKIA